MLCVLCMPCRPGTAPHHSAQFSGGSVGTGTAAVPPCHPFPSCCLAALCCGHQRGGYEPPGGVVGCHALLPWGWRLSCSAQVWCTIWSCPCDAGRCKACAGVVLWQQLVPAAAALPRALARQSAAGGGAAVGTVCAPAVSGLPRFWGDAGNSSSHARGWGRGAGVRLWCGAACGAAGATMASQAALVVVQGVPNPAVWLCKQPVWHPVVVLVMNISFTRLVRLSSSPQSSVHSRWHLPRCNHSARASAGLPAC